MVMVQCQLWVRGTALGAALCLCPTEPLRAPTGSGALALTELGSWFSSPLLSGGFTACAGKAAAVLVVEQRPLKIQMEWKDGLTWLDLHPAGKSLESSSS